MNKRTIQTISLYVLSIGAFLLTSLHANAAGPAYKYYQIERTSITVSSLVGGGGGASWSDSTCENVPEANPWTRTVGGTETIYRDLTGHCRLMHVSTNPSWGAYFGSSEDPKVNQENCGDVIHGIQRSFKVCAVGIAYMTGITSSGEKFYEITDATCSIVRADQFPLLCPAGELEDGELGAEDLGTMSNGGALPHRAYDICNNLGTIPSKKPETVSKTDEAISNSCSNAEAVLSVL